MSLFKIWVSYHKIQLKEFIKTKEIKHSQMNRNKMKIFRKIHKMKDKIKNKMRITNNKINKYNLIKAV